MVGNKKLPQIWCDFVGQVGFKLKTLFPSLPPCLVPPSVLAKGSLVGSPLPASPAGFLFPAALGAPSRRAALICGLQARGGILRSHATLWRERDLVNKHSPRRGRGEGWGEKNPWHFGDWARIKGHQAQPLLAISERDRQSTQLPWMTRWPLNIPESWGIPSVLLAWSRPNPLPRTNLSQFTESFISPLSGVSQNSPKRTEV